MLEMYSMEISSRVHQTSQLIYSERLRIDTKELFSRPGEIVVKFTVETIFGNATAETTIFLKDQLEGV